jgi:hypothetical protein
VCPPALRPAFYSVHSRVAFIGARQLETNAVALCEGVKIRRYTEAERARIRDVHTAARLAGGGFARAVRELAAELNRTVDAIQVQVHHLQRELAVEAVFGPHAAETRSDSAQPSRDAETKTHKRQFTAEELAIVDGAYLDVQAGVLGRKQAAQKISDEIGMSRVLILSRFHALHKAAGNEQK